MRQTRLRTEQARDLRQSMTPTEQKLWRALRGRRFASFKFRRQTPLCGFIVDYYCAQAKLVVELDGESHLRKQDRDERRDQTLSGAGFEVLRFWDTVVYDDFEVVLEVIWNKCSERCSSPSPPAPLPQGERGDLRRLPSDGGVCER